jgi:hypothetical protein
MCTIHDSKAENRRRAERREVNKRLKAEAAQVIPTLDSDMGPTAAELRRRRKADKKTAVETTPTSKACLKVAVRGWKHGRA